MQFFRYVLYLCLLALIQTGTALKSFSQSLTQSGSTYNIGPNVSATGSTQSAWCNVDVHLLTGKVVYTYMDYENSSPEIFCEIYGQNMGLIAAKFRVNNTVTGAQIHPRVIVNQSDNSFLIVWAGTQSGNHDIYAKRISFTADFTLVKNSSDYRINDYTGGDQYSPKVAFDYFRNNLIVTWRDATQRDGNGFGAYMRPVKIVSAALDTNGVGPDIQINQTTTGNQEAMSLQVSPVTGELIVFCQSRTGSTNNDVVRRIFLYNSGTGRYIGQTESVLYNYSTDESPLGLSIHSATGDYMVAWSSNLEDGSGWGVYAAVYDKNHSLLKTKFQVSNITANNQISPKIVWDDVNNVAVVFYIYSDQTASTTTIRYRMFNTTGSYSAIGNEVEVTTGENIKSYLSMSLYPVFNKFNKRLYLAYDVFDNYSLPSIGRARVFTYSHPDNLPLINKQQYAELKDDLDGSYYTLINKDTLYFKYVEKYNPGAAGAPLAYKIYDYKRQPLTTPVLTKYYGANFFRLGLKNIVSLDGSRESYYILEVQNDKGEIKKLRFKYIPEY